MSNDKTILHIGAGKNIIPEAINLDIAQTEGIDTVCDIRQGLPFDDESMTEVIAEYVLEQIIDNEKFKFVMNEVWRVLKPNGWFRFKVPNAKYSTAFKDPFDNRYFTKETFDYFNKEHYRYKHYSGYGFKPWTITKVEEIAGPNDKQKDRFSVTMRKSLTV